MSAPRIDPAPPEWASNESFDLGFPSRQIRRVQAIVVGVALMAAAFAPAVQAQQTLPVFLPSASLPGLGIDLVQSIDLDNLPARPSIIVEVIPDQSHPDIEFEIELRDFTPDPGAHESCPIGSGTTTDSWISDPAEGASHLEADLFFCGPFANYWDGIDADVRVRVLDFGSGGAPATFSVSIRSVTTVPTQLLAVQVSGAQSITAVANADTVLYADDFTHSNGRGDYLWAGSRTVFFPPFTNIRYPRTSLLRFSTLGNDLPPNAVLSNVEVSLMSLGILGLGGSVGIWTVPPGPFWSDGSADASGNEFFGESAPFSPATYGQRSFATNWITQGGDTTTPAPLATRSITGSGLQTFTAPDLTTEVQAMVGTDFNDGFKLTGPFGAFSSDAVQFASAENPVVEFRPSIRVDFNRPEPYAEGNVDGDLVDYLNEGENFRWIYDLDLDGIFATLVGGVCEEDYTTGDFTTPYTYSYTGAPGYVGHDCCSWRIEAAQAGIVGTGQALFFHNLDVTNPANMPPDSDGDGMLDPCDNCPLTPNGPFLGTCMIGMSVAGGTCRSNLECGAGETCDLSQFDNDGDTVGNACPEPGFGVGLMLGAMLLASRRPSRRSPRTRN